MSNKIKTIAIVFILSLGSGFTQAKNEGDVLIMPGKSLSCGQYMASNESHKNTDSIWSQGFLSGYNSYATYRNGKQLEIPQTFTITLFLKNYCQRNPLSNLVRANLVLIQELGGEPITFEYNK